MDNTYHLSKCLELIQEKLQWGKASSWTNKDFETLSDKIYDNTGILISYQTLRRLFGKVQTSIQYKPQLGTMNALAIYLGFKDWDTFKNTYPVPVPIVHTELPAAPPLEPSPVQPSEPLWVPHRDISGNKHLKLRYKAVIFGIAAILIICISSYFLFSSHNAPSDAVINFHGDNIVGEVPLNVVFRYDISKVKADSVILDFGNEGKKMVLPKNQKIVTMSYLIPGLYKANVLADNRIIGQETIHAKSANWSGLVHTATDYLFLQDHAFIKDGTMRYLPADKGVVQTSTYKPLKNNQVVEFNNFNDFDVDGDNFTFETRLKVVLPDSGKYCYKALIKVKGDRYPVRAAFVSKGCNSDALVQFGDVVLEGKFHDLSFMGQSLTQWRTVRLEVKNKHGKLYLDDKVIYSITFQQSIGLIKGLSFRFREFGEVDYVKLYNKENQLTYEENF